MARTAADVLVDRLIDWGVHVVFGLPGDGINGIMEALRTRQDRISFVQVRHEVDLLSLFKDVASYNQMALGAGHIQSLVDAGCRAALSDRGVAHITVPV